MRASSVDSDVKIVLGGIIAPRATARTVPDEHVACRRSRMILAVSLGGVQGAYCR
jgi:hypothetical protein